MLYLYTLMIRFQIKTNKNVFTLCGILYLMTLRVSYRTIMSLICDTCMEIKRHTTFKKMYLKKVSFSMYYDLFIYLFF